MSTKVILKKVRLSFPDLFEAKDYQDNKKFRYSAAFLITPGSENDKAIQAAILAEAKAKYDKNPGQIEGWRSNPNKFCYTPGELKQYDGYAGMMALSSHRYQEQGRPGVFDKNKAPLSADDGKPYAGCYVNAVVEIWAQDGKNAGMRCGLVSVQFDSDGDAFSSGTRPSDDDFEDITDGADAQADLG
jgi:hypothetical protein